VNLIRAVSLAFVLFIPTLNAGYVYEGSQPLIDLKTNYIATSYNMGVGDDQVSSVFNLDFTFTFYGEDFTTARMATNGCLHFGSSGGYCNDYTPDPLPEITYTLYPFWTDLIRDNGSSVLARNFTDKTVFGWYNLREYNRSNTDNSFEVILWKSDDSFEFRYGGLNIINHDVLIGEQGAADEFYTYLFHDECSTGTTNVAGTCVNTNWNSTSFNTLLENGGSLYGIGSGNALDCSNALNNTACPGYEAAYLTQQCDLDGLYSTQCPNYWDDLFDYECSYDSQYSPACPGYMVETFVDDTYAQDDMFGYDDYEDDQYGYYDPYEEEIYFFEEDSVYTAELQGIELYDETLYYDEFYVEETILFEEEYIFDENEHVVFVDEIDILLEDPLPLLEHIEETHIEHIYEEILLAEEYIETDYELPVLEDILLDHFEHEELIEEYLEEETIEYLQFETIEELEEWIEEDEEVLEQLAELSENENRDLEDAEAVEEEGENRDEDIELVVAENEEKKDNKRAEQLNVVANTIRAATNSISGTTAGTSAQATGTSISSGGSYTASTNSATSAQTSAVGSSVSGGTVSIDSSPSISAQVASSAQQTQEILTMSTATSVSVSSDTNTVSSSAETSTSVASNSTTSSSTVSSVAANDVSVESSSQMTQAETQVQSMQGEIETAIAENMDASEADQIADQIIAQNIENQQQELEEKQSETGEYADSSTLIAYMGYVPGFSSYSQVEVPQPSVWYEPELIYTNVNIPDNNSAFSGLYGESLTGMNDLMNMQPNL